MSKKTPREPHSPSQHDFQTTEGQSRLLSEVGPLDRFFEGAVLAAEYAGAAILQVVQDSGFGSVRSAAELKEDGSPVSLADRASHTELTKRLKAIGPFPIVSEEEPGGVPSLESVRNHPFFWLADPLDGTRDFLAGEKTYAVSLALMCIHEGRVAPYFGAICDPNQETTWWGSRETPLIKRVHSDEVDLPPARKGEGLPLRVLGSRSIPSERMKMLYEFWNVSEVTRMGSALKFALIAEGSYDVYPRFGPTSEWDTAAGQLLLEISGGGLNSIETGNPMQYGKTDWINQGFLAMSSTELMEEWLPLVRKQFEGAPKLRYSR